MKQHLEMRTPLKNNNFGHPWGLSNMSHLGNGLTAQDISSSQTHDTQENPPSTDLNDFKMEVLSLILIMGRKTRAFKCIYKNTTVEQVHYTSSIIENQIYDGTDQNHPRFHCAVQNCINPFQGCRMISSCYMHAVP
jgi:hypothetical protein